VPKRGCDKHADWRTMGSAGRAERAP
jgi:hypothetical protein